jgi:ATP-binding cassette subfamily B protein
MNVLRSLFDVTNIRVRNAVALCAVSAVFATVPLIGIAFALLSAASNPPPPIVLIAVLGMVVVGTGLQIPLAGGAAFFFRSALDRRAQELRIAVVEHLRRVPARTLAKIDPGQALATMTLGIDQAMSIVMAAFQSIVAGPLKAIGCVVVVALIDWRIALISLAFLPVVAFYVRQSRAINARATPRIVRAQAEGSSRFYEYVESVALLRAFGCTAERLKRLSSAVSELNLKAFENTVAPLTFGTVALFFIEFGFAIALMIGIEIGGNAIGVRYVLAFTLALAYFQTTFEALDGFLRLRDATAHFQIVERLLELPALPERTEGVPAQHDLALEGVAFAYDRGPVLQNMTARFPERAVTAVVGASGAGKSALASVISGAWEPTDGVVRIGGVDLRSIARDARAQTVAIVFQDTALFETTIAENIGAGRPGATHDEILAAARVAGCEAFVTRMPEGYDTVIQGDGTNLSLGERQRIAIARALLSDAPVVVLDECTASLDAESERAVHTALAELAERKTVVLITHRLGTVRRAQRILVLADGTIAESGTHEQLLAKRGEYARLWAAHERTNHWKIAG